MIRNHDMNRRRFIGTVATATAGVAVSGFAPLYGSSSEPVLKPANSGGENGSLKISVFDVDATPPVGSYLAYDQMVGTWDMGLRAKGLVLTGAGAPIVLCAIDWIGISNESQEVFKQTLADAAGTDPKRVVIHTLHQHDAPICDFSVEKTLNEMGIAPMNFDSSFQREFLARLGKAVGESLKNLRSVTDVSIGKAPVYQVASNRRIVKDGKVGEMRGSSCTNAALRAEPEGLIDPDVTLIGFWEGETPVAVMTFYATHPQSYYQTKIANPDFPGIARFYRQIAVPAALHIHFTGAGANVAAGKYNDRSFENRMILAGRLADGMERAWKNSQKMPLTAASVSWQTEPIALPVRDEVIRKTESQIATANWVYRSDNMTSITWAKRAQSGKKIDIACLTAGKARVLFAPGELFVEYQLAAKALRPDLAVSVAAYCEYGPSYIGTKEAYSQGGYEINVSPVTGDSEEIMMNAFRKLLM